MKIGGFQKMTLIDFPDKIAATVFTVGCNFRCRFCYNTDLLNKNQDGIIPEQDIINELMERKNFLDGVCITGGEPTLQPDLDIFMKKIKDMGLLVKLDTNGYRPKRLKDLLEKKLIDYIAMDIKGPLEKYAEITGITFEASRILKSISLIMNSDIEYEFRTTVMKPILNPNDVVSIAKMIKGARRYTIQQCDLSADIFDKKYQNMSSYTKEELEAVKKMASDYVQNCILLA